MTRPSAVKLEDEDVAQARAKEMRGWLPPIADLVGEFCNVVDMVREMRYTQESAGHTSRGILVSLVPHNIVIRLQRRKIGSYRITRIKISRLDMYERSNAVVYLVNANVELLKCQCGGGGQEMM